MPLTVVRRPTAGALWEACLDGFRAGRGSQEEPSPGRAGARIWLSHRNLKDLLFEAVHETGCPGWLDPPVNVIQDLPRIFGIRGKVVGPLTRRWILGKATVRLANKILGHDYGTRRGVVSGQIVDRVINDFVAEGVTPEKLQEALGRLRSEGGAVRRNRWVVAVYQAYLDELQTRGLIDPASVSALITEEIMEGRLGSALRGATELYVYGVWDPHGRRNMFRALATQTEVDVFLFLPEEPEPDPFFDDLCSRGNDTTSARFAASRPASASGPRHPPEQGVSVVQPAPGAAAEMKWVAQKVKALLAKGDTEPQRIAVVARTGHTDTRHAFRALKRAGIPATARIRTPLVEVPVLQALLLLLRGAARNWDYRTLRAFLVQPYFNTTVSVTTIDSIAASARVSGLDQWHSQLHDRLARAQRLLDQEDRDAEEGWLDRHQRRVERQEKHIKRWKGFQETLTPISQDRTETEWIAFTNEMVSGSGFMGLRRHACGVVDDRWDVVRLDQRGIIQLERLFAEWLPLSDGSNPFPRMRGTDCCADCWRPPT